MLKLRDVMSRDVFTLPASYSAAEGAWALMNRGVGAAPVRDDDGRIVGVVSKIDLLDPERGDLPMEHRTVADVMTPAVLALEESDPAIDAVHMMVSHGIHRVIVVDASGALVGIVTAMDFMKRLLKDGRLDASVPEEEEQAAESPTMEAHS